MVAQKDRMEVKGKKVTVVGLGNSGRNAAILLNDLGAAVRATDFQDSAALSDSAQILRGKNIEIEIGGHTKDFIKGSEFVVISPGVEDGSSAIKWAHELDIPMIGEMELGFRFCKGRIIGVTGTNGKSTVTTLIGEILKDAGFDTVVCGNIGNSLCGELGRIKDDTWVVLEASSFQLERTKRFRPHIALILNITDDHMDRYTKFNDYFNEKLKIFANQDKNDILILNHDAENLRPLARQAHSRVLFYGRKEKAVSAYYAGGKIFCIKDGKELEMCRISDIRLKGLHNLENVLASSLAATLAGTGADSIKNTIKRFTGLPHRFETIDTIDGVTYIDDSKGTTVDSTYRALESCAGPVILIAGGKDKYSDYTYVRDAVKRKVKDLVLIGEATGPIRMALEEVVRTHAAGDMYDAVEKASKLAHDGYTVLLSPMCSSFDMFSSYKERGLIFKQAVMRLRDKSQNEITSSEIPEQHLPRNDIHSSLRGTKPRPFYRKGGTKCRSNLKGNA